MTPVHSHSDEAGWQNGMCNFPPIFTGRMTCAVDSRPTGCTMAAARGAAAKGQKFNGIGSEAVFAKTGKTWPQWFKILDAAGAKKMEHKAIIGVLSEQH